MKRSLAKVWKSPPSPIVVKKAKVLADAAPSEPSRKKQSMKSKKKKGKAEEDLSSRAEIVESFKEQYRPALDQLPECLRPVSCKHGAHSYTRMVQGKARVEILLKNKSLKPKSKVDGTPIQSSCLRFTEWKEALKLCGVVLDEDLSSDEEVTEY